MNKKTLIQLLLLLTVLVILIAIFFKYFYGDKEAIKIENLEEKVSSVSEKNSNIIKDIEYLSKDNSGNTYLINAKTGEIDNKNPNIILLRDVKARISVVDSEDVYITSNFANYNSKNYNY